MPSSSKPTHVEFDNQSPDTIEVRPVNTMDVQNLQVPAEAVKFLFVEIKDNGFPEPVSSAYYLGNEFGSAAQMAAKFPEYAPNVSDWVKDWSIKEVGKVEWDYTVEGERYVGYMLVPLTEEIVLIRKDTREIIWPVPEVPGPIATTTGGAQVDPKF